MWDFSVSGLCRRHGLGNITQVCFGISVSNFMCMSFVAVGKSLTIFSYIAFRMATLWFWAMFNCNPPIGPLLPSPILVDHWSTISSFSWEGQICLIWVLALLIYVYTFLFSCNKIVLILFFCTNHGCCNTSSWWYGINHQKLNVIYIIFIYILSFWLCRNVTHSIMACI